MSDSGLSGGTVRVVLLVATTAVLAVVATLGVLYATGALASQSRQEVVADRGEDVMPFDPEKTTHIFEPSETGGAQKVIADNPQDAEQISLVRDHLQKEAEAFENGDLSDPAEIHGEDMPGLSKLEAGAPDVEVRYSELPDGARIQYETKDSELVAALHDWFEAQLSDHGNDATSKDDSMSHEQHPRHD